MRKEMMTSNIQNHVNIIVVSLILFV